MSDSVLTIGPTSPSRWDEPKAPIRIGTRGSRLAVAQAQIVADHLSQITGRSVELVLFTTHGDMSKAALVTMGGMGIFATELRQGLLQRECDVVVHSLKDLPVEPYPGLVVTAHCFRSDMRDALCSKGGRNGLKFMELPPGAKVGTGSPRRVCQLKLLRSDIQYISIRGNIDTRLKYTTEGDFDAVILAAAGLQRLGLDKIAVTEYFNPEDVIPSAGQGCLAVEICEGSNVPGVKELNDFDTHFCVLLEREILRRLGAGCHAPVGCCCYPQRTKEGPGYIVKACVNSICGVENLEENLWISRTVLDGIDFDEELGPQLRPRCTVLVIDIIERLCNKGAHFLVWEARILFGDPVLLIPRDGEWGEVCAETCKKYGWFPLITPLILTSFLPSNELCFTRTDEEEEIAITGQNALNILDFQKYKWIIFTSREAVNAIQKLKLAIPDTTKIKIACVGQKTKEAVEKQLNLTVSMCPEGEYSSAVVLSEIFFINIDPMDRDAPILWIRGTEASSCLSEELRGLGFSSVDKLIVYTTKKLPVEDRIKGMLGQARKLGVLLTSSSCADAFAAAAIPLPAEKLRVITIGKTTAHMCETLGIVVSGIAKTPSIMGMMDALGKASPFSAKLMRP